MKIVYRTGDYTDFLVCRSKLEQAGFHVHSDNFESYSVMPYIGLNDGYRIWVADDEFDAAISLLSSSHGIAASDGEAATEEVNSCPQCGADGAIKYVSSVLMPILWIFGALLPPLGRSMLRCSKCGHRYETESQPYMRPYRVLVVIMVALLLLIVAVALLQLK